MILNFAEIAECAGFLPEAAGKFNLPATQETANKLAAAALNSLPAWEPGQDDSVQDIVLTGAGPVWGYLAIAHALHGRVRSLTYAAPNAPEIVIFRHGA